MPQYPVTKQFCFTLCTVMCGLVFEWITRANPNFFINEVLKFRKAVIFQFLHIFIRKITKNLAIFCSFCKVFTFYSSRKNVWKLTIFQKSTVPHNSVQVFLHQDACFVGFYFPGGRNENLWTFPSVKTPDCLITLLCASSISSTMKHKLLQKSTELKIDGRKSFT